MPDIFHWPGGRVYIGEGEGGEGERGKGGEGRGMYFKKKFGGVCGPNPETCAPDQKL